MHNKEKMLRALMQSPRSSDREVSKIVGVSQPTISRARTFLEKQGLVRYEIIPDFERLGYEIFAITVFKEIAPETPNIVYVANTIEGIVVFSVHKNYTGYVEFIRGYDIHSRYLICTKPMKALSFKNIPLPAQNLLGRVIPSLP